MEQADIFERKLLFGMANRQKALDGYFMAKRFGTWCNANLPGRFRSINHDLAALSSEVRFPVGSFLYALDAGTRARPETLVSWLHEFETCQELWHRLRILHKYALT